jgi:SAM-dependent methyltransferase
VESRDHFSSVASGYAAFRPRYPTALFDWLALVSHQHNVAWDCACGSGQASWPLASHFDMVVATDVSPTQVATATPTETIRCVVAAAELVPLADGVVDLVSVAQALHWFVGEAFFAEVRRVVGPGGVFAAWTYGMPHIVSDAVETAVHRFINELLGPYWAPEIRLVLDGYASIDLPFAELETPGFEMRAQWTLARFLGFVRTWSAVGRFVETHCEDPVVQLAAELGDLWGSEGDLLTISWRLDLRAGRV